MDEAPPKRRGRFSLAFIASLVIHAAVVVPFFVTLPERAAEPPVEQTVDVEIVPEPEAEPEAEKEAEPKPAEAPKPPEPARPQPQPPPQAQPQPEPQPKVPPEDAAAPAAPPPFEASSRQDTDAPPDPVDLPAEAEETPKTSLDPADDTRAQEPPEPSEASEASEPSQPPEPAEAKADPAPPAILSAERGAGDDARPDTPSAAAPVPDPQTETPMTASEQAVFIPAKPAVPATKPPPEAAPTPAKTLYAKDMLADPRVRGALAKLAPEKRIVQICVIEAGEQVRHSGARLTPDLLKGFGRNGGLISGTHLSAKGGAVRSRGAWYDIRFECTVNDAFDTITAFRFALGDRVPRQAWAARGLMAE